MIFLKAKRMSAQMPRLLFHKNKPINNVTLRGREYLDFHGSFSFKFFFAIAQSTKRSSSRSIADNLFSHSSASAAV